MSCHTNNLKDYRLESAKVNYTHRVSGDAARGSSNLYTGGGVAGVVGAIGSAAFNVEIAEKLDRVAKPEVLASAVSTKMQSAINAYLRAATSGPDDASFLFETDLVEYSINCSSGGIYVNAKAECRLIDRSTGKIVWDDCESESVNLVQNVPGAILSGTPVGAAVGVVQCSQLLEMSDDQLRRSLERAAEEVAHSIAETLREDVADLPAK